MLTWSSCPAEVVVEKAVLGVLDRALGERRTCCVLHDHEARFQSRIGCEEGRQTASGRIQHLVHSAFGYRPQFKQR